MSRKSRAKPPKRYGIKASAVAGGFAMCVAPEQNMLFRRDCGGRVEIDEDGFHMWVQTETHVIDFHVAVIRRGIQGRAAGVDHTLADVQKRLT
jgi:hypothetical protein